MILNGNFEEGCRYMNMYVYDHWSGHCLYGFKVIPMGVGAHHAW